MSKTIDEKVVSMKFDNKQFEDNVKTSMSTLDKLKEKLKFKNADDGLKNVSASAKKVDMNSLGSSVDTVSAKFSSLQVMGVTALANITNSVVNAGKKMVSALTIVPLKDGLSEYENQINSVQTIMANTGDDVKTVNNALDELNEYADLTIYNFAEMTKNAGTFTAALGKGSLDQTMTSLKGIGNWAAYAGASAEDMARASFNLAQGLSAGSIRLQDWMSIEHTAGMSGQNFQNEFKETAKSIGIDVDSLIEKNGSFRESLKEGWLTTDVFMKTMERFANDQSMTDAATKVKTFSQLIDTLKEALGTGWAQTWRLIIGDFEEAKSLWSSVYEVIGGFIDKMSDARNTLLESALGKGFTSLSDKISKITGPAKKAAETIDKTVEAVSDLGGIVDEVILGKFGNGEDRFNALTEAGQNYYRIQNKVNETLGNSFRYTEEQIAAQDKLLGSQKKTIEGTTKEAEETSKLTDEKKKLIKSIASMTEEEMREAGYKEEQISAFKELGDTAKKLGIPLNEFIDNMDQINGRWLLLNSFKNIGTSIVKIFTAIGDAFREIFSPITSDQLFNVIAGFHRLTANMVISDETAGYLKRTFKGLFAVLDLVASTVGGGLKLAFKVVSYILSYFDTNILEVTAHIGDALVAFRDWVKEHDLLKTAIDTVLPYIEIMANAIKNWFDGLKETDNIPKYIIEGLVNGIRNGIGLAVSAIIDLGKSIIEGICGILGIHSPSTEFFDIGSNIIQGLINGLKDGFSSVIDFVKKIGSGIIGVIQEIDFGYIFAGMMGVGALVLLKKLSDIFEVISGPIQGVTSILEGISNVFNKLAASIKASALKKKSQAILNFTIAIGVLAASVYVLSKIDTNGLLKAGAALVVLSGLLIGFSLAISKFDKLGDNTGKVSALLLSMGAALLLMAKVAKIVGGLKTDELVKGLAFIAVLELFIAGLISISWLSGEHANKAGKMISKIAFALLTMAVVTKLVSKLSTEELKKGLSFIFVLELFIISLVAISKLSGEYASKAGSMILKIAIALGLIAGVVKIVGNLKDEELGKGLAFINMLELFIIALIGVSVLAGKNASKAGSMILKIAVSLAIIAGAIKIVGTLSTDELGKGLAFINTLEMFIIALVAVSALAGKNATKAGFMLIGVATALGIMALVVKMAGSMDSSQLLKGLAVVSALEVFIVALIAVSQFAGKNAMKAGSMIMKVAVSLLIMTGALFLISKMNTTELWKAVGVIAVLEALFAGLIAVTKFANDCNKTIIAMTACILLLVSAVAALTLLNPDNLSNVSTSLSMIMSAFATIIYATGNMKDTKGVITKVYGLLGVVVALAAILGVMSALNVEGSIQTASALSILMTSLSASLLIISNVKDVSLKAVGALALMGLVVAELGVILGVMSALNVEISMSTVLALSTMMLAMSGSLLIIGIVGTYCPGAMAGIGSLMTLIGAMGVMMAAIGGLNELTQGDLATFVNSSIPILQDFGEGLGNFIGGLVGGVIAGAVDSLSGIGTSLSNFMNELKPFIDSASGIDPTSMEGVKTLADAILTLTASNLLDGLANFLGGRDMSELGTQMVSFGKALVSFSNTVKGNVDQDAVQAAANAGTLMAEMQSKIVPSGGVIQYFTGEKDMAEFGTQLVAFGKAIVQFSQTVSGDGAINETAVTAAANAGSIMSELQSNLTATGGVIQEFTGEKDLSTFGTQLVAYGSAIVQFSKTVSEEGAINETAIQSAANAGSIMSELQSNLSSTGGVIEFFTGSKSLSKFGKQIKSFGESLVDFSQTIEEGGISQSSVTAAACAGMMMASLQEAIPEKNAFDGKVTLKKFGKQIKGFGKSIAKYAEEVAGIDINAVTASVEAGKGIVTIAKTVQEVDLDSLKNADFTTLGYSLKSYYDSIKDIDTYKISSSTSSISSLVKTINSMSSINTSGISSFKSAMKTLSSTNIKGLADNFTSQTSKMSSIGSTIVSAIKTGMVAKQGTLTSTVSSIVTKMRIAAISKVPSFVSAGSSIMAKFISGVKTKSSSAASAFTSMLSKAITSVRNYYNNFYNAGSHVVSGFALGITANTFRAEARARAMAKAAYNAAKKALDINSPSKVFRRLAYSVPEGFAQGIDRRTGLAVNSSKEMANAAIDATKQSILHLGDMISDDIDTQPTIRPVMDLSDIKSGVGTMNGWFAASQSIGASSNVSAISAMMNNRQNGKNSDVVSAINKLSKSLGNTGNTSYTINGITYDDGTNISEAVKTLVRAARVERRM